jgi:hypothetical protein
MAAIPAATLLDLWERGEAQHPLHRPLTLLHAASPASTVEELAALSIGDRDRGLLELRRKWLGERFDAVAICPACGEQLEFSIEAGNLPLTSTPQSGSLTVNGIAVQARTPTTLDLLAAAEAPEEARREILLARCAGEGVSADSIHEVEDFLSSLDPMLDVGLGLSCPACGHTWRSTFDVAGYFWTEVSDLARRLMGEVHTLAQAYGWSEREILSLSPRRRRMYLALVLGD